MAGDAHFNETKVSTFQENPPLEHDLPPHVPIRSSHDSILAHHSQESPGYDTEYNLATDHSQFRRRQSNVSIQEPRCSFVFNSPYNQDPTKLTGSDSLEEMFHTPVDHARRRTLFSIPESLEVPRRAYGISGVAPPPPGDGPPDDEDSSSSPPYPSPLLPRPTGYPYRDRPNPPGRSDGNGEPPDGDPGGRHGPTPVWGMVIKGEDLMLMLLLDKASLKLTLTTNCISKWFQNGMAT